MDITVGYLLLAVALVLLSGEMVLPSGGILFMVGVAGLVSGFAVVCANDPAQGLIAFVVLVLLSALAGPFVRSTLNRVALADVPAGAPLLELEALRGCIGRTASPLRPSGFVEIDGRRLEAISEGPLIAAGKWVRCVDVRPGYLVVREITNAEVVASE